MIGETLGSYKLTKLIGKGGFGVVYAAEHSLIGRKAAVKLLRAAYTADSDIVRRFFNEARATTLIKHPGIVDVYDFGFHTDGAAYLVMELLEGESLASRMGTAAHGEVGFLVIVGRQIASALAAAHKKGIIHRDLKPENVFLVPEPESADGVRVKLLDFGVAKLVSTTTSVATQSGSVLGTPIYMSPEQCRGAERVDPRSDLYSLGCILYEMACGGPPFYERGLGDMILAHMQQEPKPPRAIDPGISVSLEDLILRLLAKDPDDRPQTADEVVRELNALVVESERSTHARLATGSVRSSLSEIPTTTVPKVRLRAPRRLWLFVPAAGLAVGAAALVLRQASGPTVEPRPAAAPASAPTPAPVPAPTVERPRMVRVVVDSQPQGAEIVRVSDGEVVGRTPFAENVVESIATVSYVLKMPGYLDARVEVTHAEDGKQVVTLAPVPKAPARDKPAAITHPKGERKPVKPAPGTQPSHDSEPKIYNPFEH
jgi:serine/threonine-protein kinase